MKNLPALKPLKWLRLSLLVTTIALATAVQADVAKVLETCSGCHGKDGASTDSAMPIIGGYSATYLSGSLTNYKNKARPCPKATYNAGAMKGQSGDMCTIAGALSDADITGVADALSKKPFVRAKQTADAAKAAKGKAVHDANCTKCHTEGGASADDDAGILAGQWMTYVNHTFEEFKSGERPLPKKMKPKFDALTKEDMEALANYYGSFK
jgi:sulfide dehydrogenase cytochrome subunit